MRNARWLVPVLALLLSGCRHMESTDGEGANWETKGAATRFEFRNSREGSAERRILLAFRRSVPLFSEYRETKATRAKMPGGIDA